MNTTSSSHHQRARWIAAGLAGLVAAVALGVAAPNAAAADVTARPAVASTTPRERLEKACARIPAIQGRVDQAIDLIQGDATVRGSLAWLQSKIDRATAAGRTELVDMLEARLATRQQRLGLLQSRQAELADFSEFCASNGVSP